ncbi:MAG: hypothetical protein NW215_15775 [Hyphomicrobiales bacterium]|nr:hypothetical protein [Hyphomicrobiales bacterium]
MHWTAPFRHKGGAGMNGGLQASLILAVTTLATASLAQSPPEPPPPTAPRAPEPQPPTLDPRACAPGERITPGQQMGRSSEPTEHLSDKLARTEGVLCPPPGIDPHIVELPPAGGAIKVIPPPK